MRVQQRLSQSVSLLSSREYFLIIYVSIIILMITFFIIIKIKKKIIILYNKSNVSVGLIKSNIAIITIYHFNQLLKNNNNCCVYNILKKKNIDYFLNTNNHIFKHLKTIVTKLGQSIWKRRAATGVNSMEEIVLLSIFLLTLNTLKFLRFFFNFERTWNLLISRNVHSSKRNSQVLIPKDKLHLGTSQALFYQLSTMLH